VVPDLVMADGKLLAEPKLDVHRWNVIEGAED